MKRTYQLSFFCPVPVKSYSGYCRWFGKGLCLALGILVILFTLFVRPVQAQRVDLLPSASASTTYAADGNYMVRAVQNTSRVDLEFFRLSFGQWEKTQTVNLKADQNARRVEEIALDGRLVAVTVRREDGTGLLLPYRLENDEWILKNAFSLTQQNMQDNWGSELEIYDSGNPSGSYIVVGVPGFSNTGLVALFGFSSGWGLNPSALSILNGSAPDIEFGYQAAISKDYLALVRYKQSFPHEVILDVYKIDDLINDRSAIKRLGNTSPDAVNRFALGDKVQITNNEYIAYTYSKEDRRNQVRIGRIADFFNATSTQDRENVFDELDMPNAIDDEFGETLDFLTSKTPDGTNYYLAVGAPFTEINSSIVAGRVYLYNFEGVTSPGRWGTTQFSSSFNGEKLEDQLGYELYFTSSGLIAPTFIANTSKYINFIPSPPALSSLSSSTNEIRLSVEKNEADENLTGQVFGPTFTLTDNTGQVDITETSGSFTVSDTDLSLGIGDYATLNVVAENAFGQSPPLATGAFFKGDGRIQGTVKNPQGGNVDGVRINTKYDGDYYLLFGLSAGIDDFIKAPVSSFPTRDFTVEFWANPSAVDGRYLISYSSSEGGDNTFTFGWSDRNILNIWINSNSYSINVDKSLSNVWSHYAITRSGTSLKLYIDGEEATTRSVTDSQISAEGFLVIGQDSDSPLGRNFDANQNFKGLVDELRIWNTVRTDEDIRQNYNSVVFTDATNKNEDLVLNYRFDENIGASPFRSVYDEKANAGSADSNPGLLTQGTGSSGINYVKSSGLNKTAVTENGSFSFTNLTYGEYTLIPDDEGGDRIFERDDESVQEVQVNVSADGTTPDNINFIDVTSFTVAGQVTIEYEGNTYPAANVPLAYGATATIEGSADTVYTDADGNYEIELKAGEFTVFPEFADHTFAPAQAQISLPADKDDPLNFVNTTTRTISGTFVGGSCELNVGSATLNLRNATTGIEINGIKTDFDGNVHRYQVEGVPAFIKDSVGLTVVELGNEGKQPDDADFLVLEKLIRGEGGFLDAEQFVPLDSMDTTVNFFYRAPTELSVESSSLEKIECFENTYLMSEGDVINLSISAFETYNGEVCQVDSAEVQIFDDISDRPDSLTYITTDNFNNFAYGLRAGNPNVVGGGQRPYQKALQIDVTPPGAPTVSKTIWAVVEGSTPRIGQPFVATRPSNVPLFILRDPPGDQSYSYIEEGSTLSQNISISDGGSGSVGTTIGIGDKDATPFAETNIEVGFSGADSKSFDVSLTTLERIETSTEDGVPPGKQSDVFVGTNVNVLYGLIDVLDFNPQLCEPTLTQEITWFPDEIDSDYYYTYNFIQTNIIPTLKETIALSTDPDRIAGLKVDIKEWRKLLAYNDFLNEEGKPADLIEQNISFDGGLGSRETSQTITTTRTDEYTFSTTFDLSLEIGTAISIPIPFLGFQKVAEASFETSVGYAYNESGSTTSEEFFTVGYVLDDDDVGDVFSLNVASKMEDNPDQSRDFRTVDLDFKANTPLTNTTPFFELIAGESSAPWEGLPSVPRDSAQINVSPRRQTDVPPGESAVFTINVGNLSQSGDARDVEVRVLPGTNPDGLIITTGSGNLTGNAGILLEDVAANDSRTITFTAQKGPLAFDYRDIAIVALSPYELEATAGSQRLSDTTFFSVSFDTPCEPVNVFLPEENWVINSGNNNSMRVVIDEYNKENIDQVVLQYRRLPIGEWQTLDAIQGSELNDFFTATAVDVSSLDDGEYQFRAATDCGSGLVFSEYFTGVMDRQAPEVLNDPQPSDGVLSPEDVIALTFSEDIDPVSIQTENFILTNTATGDTLDVDIVSNERRVIINFDNEDPANENQLFQATARRVSDRYGNVIAPLRWNFIVNRNPVSWRLPRIIEYMSEGENFAFDAQVVNSGELALDFTLESLPEWMEVISERKTIEASETRFISFRVTDPSVLKAGETYRQTLELVTDLGREPLEVILKVSCPKPAWAVNAEDFTFSMEVTASPNAGDLPLAQPNDRVAAFVGNEVRGVAEVYKLVPDDRFTAYLQVYSNQENGENVTFKLFDASECEMIDLPLTVNFEDQSAVGSPDAPEIPQVPDANMGYQEIALSAGTNWISFNVAQADMSVDNVVANLGLRDGSFISTHDGNFAQFVNFEGWQGTLDTLQTGKLYKLNVPADTVLRLNGNKAVNEISIQEGWNGIGFVKKEATAVAQAFQNYGLSEGDELIGQNTAATYANGSWSGALDTLKPGEGYLLKSGTAGTLSYARMNNSTGWTVNPGEYNQYMNVVGILEIDGVEYGKNDAVIGAFVGDECRGYVQPIQTQGQWIYFMTVYGNSTADTLTFRMQRNGQEAVELEQEMVFSNESLQGEVRAPYLFSITNPEILQPVNQAPTAIVLSDSSVLSGVAEDRIGIFSALDPNPGEQFTYSLVAGEGDANNNLFEIRNDQLVNKEALAFSATGNNTYPIRVQVTDRAGSSFERVFNVTVVNSKSGQQGQNNAPTAITISNDSILFTLENGTLVGDLSVTDPDEGDTHTFTISSINNDPDNALFSINGSQLILNAELSESMRGVYDVVIVVNDGNGGEYTETLSITITGEVNSVGDALNGQLELGAFHPNPTTDQGSFSYTLPKRASVTLRVVDMMGKVWKQQAETHPAGRYAVTLDLSDLPGGVYIYSIETGGDNPQMLMKRVVKY